MGEPRLRPQDARLARGDKQLHPRVGVRDLGPKPYARFQCLVKTPRSLGSERRAVVVSPETQFQVHDEFWCPAKPMACRTINGTSSLNPNDVDLQVAAALKNMVKAASEMRTLHKIAASQ